MLIIYTDGACSGNPGPGGWATLIFNQEKLLKVLAGYQADTTNNRMEIIAALSGLKQLKPGENATLFTDSQYLRTGVTTWLANWKRKNWKTADKKPVKNQELWRELDSLNHSGIIWQYVPGHDNNLYNEICDHLARKMIITKGKSVDLSAEFEKHYWQLQKKS
ncbi:MAG: ribonuclease HI [bacterium]